MACIHISLCPKVKDLIYPNITDNIDFYQKSKLYILPEFHGSGLKNWNGFRKRIDYSGGYQYILPTTKPYWRKTKDKYKLQRVYNIRYQTQYNIRYLAKVKGYYYFNHRTKEYVHHNWWHKRVGF